MSFEPIRQSITELIAERDELQTQVETLRAEALAWHKRCADLETTLRKYKILLDAGFPQAAECNLTDAIGQHENVYANRED
jgi:uncharacterized coiled-coil DUF342 family protein